MVNDFLLNEGRQSVEVPASRCVAASRVRCDAVSGIMESSGATRSPMMCSRSIPHWRHCSEGKAVLFVPSNPTSAICRKEADYSVSRMGQPFPRHPQGYGLVLVWLHGGVVNIQLSATSLTLAAYNLTTDNDILEAQTFG